MVHPSETGIDYIWEKFSNMFISAHTMRLWNEAARITRAMAHRLSGGNEGKRETAIFASAMLEKINDLKNRAPFLNFDTEEDYFKKLL
jgi:hypothetical protein